MTGESESNGFTTLLFSHSSINKGQFIVKSGHSYSTDRNPNES